MPEPAVVAVHHAADQSQHWKALLAEQRAALRDHYFETRTAATLLNKHCRLIDQQLRQEIGRAHV